VQQSLPVLSSSLTLLFLIDNPAANFPVSARHDGVDGSRGTSAGLLQQTDKLRDKFGIRRVEYNWFLGAHESSLHHSRKTLP
jgi:hypothetical protein